MYSTFLGKTYNLSPSFFSFFIKFRGDNWWKNTWKLLFTIENNCQFSLTGVFHETEVFHAHLRTVMTKKIFQKKFLSLSYKFSLTQKPLSAIFVRLPVTESFQRPPDDLEMLSSQKVSNNVSYICNFFHVLNLIIWNYSCREVPKISRVFLAQVKTFFQTQRLSFCGNQRNTIQSLETCERRETC